MTESHQAAALASTFTESRRVLASLSPVDGRLIGLGLFGLGCEDLCRVCAPHVDSADGGGQGDEDDGQDGACDGCGAQGSGGRCSLLGLLDLAVDVVERGLSPVAFLLCVPCFLLGILVDRVGVAQVGPREHEDADESDDQAQASAQ